MYALSIKVVVGISLGVNDSGIAYVSLWCVRACDPTNHLSDGTPSLVRTVDKPSSLSYVLKHRLRERQ
jgi:hypothetical protein